MIIAGDRLKELAPSLLDPFDPELVNTASIDIRIGWDIKIEVDDGFYADYDLRTMPEGSLFIEPGTFFLASTFERITVPNDCAIDLRLKSSRARAGWNHALAFYFDPGWNGVGTMEIKNWTQHTTLDLKYGMRFGQIIVHQLDGTGQYTGRYQNATRAEESKFAE